MTNHTLPQDQYSGRKDHRPLAAEQPVQRAGQHRRDDGNHQVHGLDDGGRAGAAHHIRRIIGDGAHDEYVVYAIADDVQHIEHPRFAAEQHFGRAAGAYVVLVVRDLYDALLCGEIVCEAADDADSAHDHGGEQEPAGAAAVDEVAAVVQRAEQLEQRQAGHSADARADAAAQIAVHVDGTPVRVAVGRQAAHAVVGDGNKGIEGFKNKIDHQRQNDGSGLRGFEIAEQQYHRNRPGHREPQREGTAALAVFEFVVHGPEADQRVVDRVPDGRGQVMPATSTSIFSTLVRKNR